MHLLHTMQPSVRKFPLDEQRQTSLTSCEIDPLLQFESEDRSVGRPAPGAPSVHSSSSSSVFRSESARTRQKIESRPAARSKASRSAWRLRAGAMFGSVLVVGALVLIDFPWRITVNPLASPLPAAPTVPTRTAIELGTDTAAVVPVTPVHEKKPVAPVSAKPRSPLSDAPAAPQPVAERQTAPVRFYGALMIDSIPVGARAFINGEPVGITPLVLTELPVGSRAIRLEADDHSAWSSTVRIVADQQTRVSATLTPAR